MQIHADSIEEYMEKLPEDRKPAMEKLFKVIKKHIPKGFKENNAYGMIGFCVPHSLFPQGYHCDPAQPLPFMGIASQKNFIALYHMGIYAQKELMDWFVAEYPKYCNAKLDMGKSCIRFKKVDQIPYELVAQLSEKMTPRQWIDCYQGMLKNGKK